MLLIAFCVAGFLVLIASLISTAPSLAESQHDTATLAAVGPSGIPGEASVVFGNCQATTSGTCPRCARARPERSVFARR